jgi:hypothetical protein
MLIVPIMILFIKRQKGIVVTFLADFAVWLFIHLTLSVPNLVMFFGETKVLVGNQGLSVHQSLSLKTLLYIAIALLRGLDLVVMEIVNVQKIGFVSIVVVSNSAKVAKIAREPTSVMFLVEFVCSACMIKIAGILINRIVIQ